MWTYAVGLSDNNNYPLYNCPCAAFPGPPAPAFVGNDYYCESGIVGPFEAVPYYLSDPLWDGAGCTVGDGCCTHIGMPWFHRTLTSSVAEDLKFVSVKTDLIQVKMLLLKSLKYTFSVHRNN